MQTLDCPSMVTNKFGLFWLADFGNKNLKDFILC